MSVICDYRSLRIGDRIFERTNPGHDYKLSVVSNIDSKEFYKILIGNPTYFLRRGGYELFTIRANHILHMAVGDLPQNVVDSFWANHLLDPEEWDANHYDRTMPEKLEILKGMWQAYCDRGEQMAYEARYNL